MIFRSLWRLLFARRRAKSAIRSETTPTTVVISTPEERKVMNSGFDMQNEIAKLAECVVEPVAAKLTTQELEPVVGQIRHAVEELNTTRTAAETDSNSTFFTGSQRFRRDRPLPRCPSPFCGRRRHRSSLFPPEILEPVRRQRRVNRRARDRAMAEPLSPHRSAPRM